jgi:hypothetical protein
VSQGGVIPVRPVIWRPVDFHANVHKGIHLGFERMGSP